MRTLRPGSISRLAVVGVLLALAGCGGPQTTVDKKILQKTAAPSQPQPGFDGAAFTRQVVGEVNQAWSDTRTLSFDMSSYTVTLDGQPGTNRVHFWFEKPNRNALKVLSSSDSRTVGTKLVWLGGPTLSVRTQFIGFWITADVDLHDSRATDNRGYFVDQTCINNTLATFLEPRNQIAFQGFATLDGGQVAQFGVVSPRSLKGVSREVFAIEARRKLPIMREMYDVRDRLVYRIHLENAVVNGTLDKDAFKAK